MLLKIEDLKVSYKVREGYFKALKGVSFEVRRGEILGVVGESGSGKTTLAFSILNLLPQDAFLEGRIFLKGKILPISPLKRAISCGQIK